MDLFKVVVTAVLTTLALVAFAGVVSWSLWPRAVEAHGFGLGHGWSGSGVAGPDRCARLGPRHAEVARALLAAHLDLSSEQEAALEPAMMVIEGWRQAVVSTCLQPISTTPEGLAALREVVRASADALDAIEPAVAAFYTGLDDEQRAQLDRWIEHHRAGAQTGALR